LHTRIHHSLRSAISHYLHRLARPCPPSSPRPSSRWAVVRLGPWPSLPPPRPPTGQGPCTMSSCPAVAQSPYVIHCPLAPCQLPPRAPSLHAWNTYPPATPHPRSTPPPRKRLFQRTFTHQNLVWPPLPVALTVGRRCLLYMSACLWVCVRDADAWLPVFHGAVVRDGRVREKGEWSLETRRIKCGRGNQRV
jgi:hypothetical protein